MAHDPIPSLPFADRIAAGVALADALIAAGVGSDEPVIVALPRGGVPVAAEVARALAAPLDLIIVRKLGVPGQPELAMGAIGEGAYASSNPTSSWRGAITADALDAVQAHEESTLRARAQRLRGDRPRVSLAGRTVVIVDDGLATGSTARARSPSRARPARRGSSSRSPSRHRRRSGSCAPSPTRW